MHKTLTVLGLAVIAACGAPARDARPMSAPAGPVALEPAPPAVPHGLDWLPADTVTVERYPHADAPLIPVVKGWLGTEAPACFSAITAKLTAVYTIKLAGEDNGLAVFEGDWRRDEVEACFEEVLEVFARYGKHVPLRRDGAIMTLALSQPVHLGWDGDRRIFWGSDRARVAAALDGTARVTFDHPLTPLLARIDPAMTSTVSIVDHASPVIGVPSDGLVVHKDVVNKRFVGWLRFATPDDARRALEVLEGKVDRGELDGFMGGWLRRVKPVLDGRELTADLMPAIAPPSALDRLPTKGL